MDYDYRKGAKERLRLSAKRKKTKNLENWRRAKKLACEGPSTDNIKSKVETLTERSTNLYSYGTDSPTRVVLPEEADLRLNLVLSSASVPTTSTKYDIPGPSTNYSPPVETLSSSVFLPTSSPINDQADIDYFESSLLSVENCGSNTSNIISEQPASLEGRRIVDLHFFLKNLIQVANHNRQFDCRLEHLTFIKEVRCGLSSTLKMKCMMCNEQINIDTCDNKNSEVMDVNTSAVNGIINIGSGFSHLEEFLTTLQIPCMSPQTYTKIHNNVCEAFEATALEKMKEAAQLEKKLALEAGNIGPDGVAEITVVCDGSWAKRSYRTKYNSLSGMAAIVGYRTKQVLYIGVRNKYCTICNRAEKKNETPKEHHCYKNWTGSSSSMEASVICEGFQKSIEMYGLRYTRMIADGDSSCYKKILDARPYPQKTVEKIECRNHLLRNFCNKLREIVTNTKAGPLILRKRLENKIRKMRSAVTKAVAHRKEEIGTLAVNTLNLKKDILNIASHTFGEHKKCIERGYFCEKGEPDEDNSIPEFIREGIYDKIMEPLKYLSNHSRSLIFDVDSNSVEQFNSQICKFIGGKRINYAMGRSYQARCSAAVIQHNTKKTVRSLHKYFTGKSPTTRLFQKFENRRLKKATLNKSRRNLFPTTKKSIISNASKEDYGRYCQKPDLDPKEYEQAKELFINDLILNEDERERLEIRTREQSESAEWRDERRKLLTASNFGIVCRRKATTSCKNLVKTLLYRDIFFSKATQWGKSNEENAIIELEQRQGVKIERCGLFKHSTIPYLAATPDGTIGTTGLVEVKCPFSAREMTPEEGVASRKITFWKLCQGVYEINKCHKWFYQIQGQLIITQRNYCLFAVWTPKGMKSEIIFVDRMFWENNMLEKLKAFYEDCLLPELVDPRHSRSMEIREPEYIIKAQTKNSN